MKSDSSSAPPAAAAGGTGHVVIPFPGDDEMDTLLTSLLDKNDDHERNDGAEVYPALSIGIPPTKLVGRTLSIQEKAQLFDEQAEAAEALSSVLSLGRGGDDRAITEQAMITALGLSNSDGAGSDIMDEQDFSDLFGTFPFTKKSPPWWKKICGGDTPVSPQERLSFRALLCMIVLSVVAILGTAFVLWYGETSATDIPKRQPIGPYRAVEIQEGDSFFDYYNGKY
jgi:hypothetical protein